MVASVNSSDTIRLSAPVYFGCVALLTAMGFVVAMEFRPSLAHSIRSALRLERQPASLPGSFYTARVAPLFEEHCISCHGAHRQKAALRLDSFAAAMRGGKHGPVILARDWKGSELMTRLTLPPEDLKAMPPSGKSPLSADEVKVIRLWIAAGASGELPVAAIRDAPPPVVKIEFPKVDEAAVARARAPLAQTVRQLQERFPGVLSYEARSSADLEVNASLLGHAFGDAELSAFTPVRERVVWADLSGTSISDASAEWLSQCKLLRVLRLQDTRVAESSLAELRRKGVRIHDGRDVSPAANARS